MMDETFIKMCRKAVEIQKQWKQNIYDIFGWAGGDGNYHFIRVTPTVLDNFTMDPDLTSYFWIPRQDDLQLIYKELKELSFDCCYKQFKKWDAFRYQQEEFEHGRYSFNIFETGDWNVLWLCFVMETCYNKQWNGETWGDLV